MLGVPYSTSTSPIEFAVAERNQEIRKRERIKTG